MIEIREIFGRKCFRVQYILGTLIIVRLSTTSETLSNSEDCPVKLV